MVSAETVQNSTASETVPLDPKSSSITIIHFNDVYNVEEQSEEPMAGAARFKTALKSFDERKPLILFSGDILSPSIMSTFTQGEQMIHVMNQLGVHCAVYGNHDFDFGLERLIEVAERTDCAPWLISNVIDNETDRPLAEGAVTKIINWCGWKIGLMGLVEREWLDTLSTINPEEVTFYDYIDKGKELAKELKDQGCHYIIALTHMRTPNDLNLAENVDEIDLFLGGHDHVYETTKVNGKYILKSGTDFREFSVLTLTESDGKIDVDIEKVEVTGKFAQDQELANALVQFEGVVNEKMDDVLGNFGIELDGRFASIRTSETNLGNFICDVLLAACNGDVTVINSGTFRSDRIHPKGEFKMRDLMTILPMLDSLCVLEVTGEQLLEVLENGVSLYPRLEGRFPQVAGLQFAFNPERPSGSRVLKQSVKVGDEALNPSGKYRFITKDYMRNGRDGYNMLVDCPVLQDEEQCPAASTAVHNHFKAVNTILGRGRRHSTHRQSLLLLSRRHSLIRGDDELLTSGSKKRDYARSASIDLGSWFKPGLVSQHSVQDLELEACKLTPRIDGRIICTTDEQSIESLREEKRLQERSVSTIEEVDEPSTPKTTTPPAQATIFVTK